MTDASKRAKLFRESKIKPSVAFAFLQNEGYTYTQASEAIKAIYGFYARPATEFRV